MLPRAPLQWMMKKAQSQGLAFRNDVDLDGDALSAPLADSYKEFAYGLYSKATSVLYRTIAGEPVVQDNGTHVNVNESIDKSVFDRWRADPSYRPRNLVEWADRKHVDPSQIAGPVRGTTRELPSRIEREQGRKRAIRAIIVATTPFRCRANGWRLAQSDQVAIRGGRRNSPAFSENSFFGSRSVVPRAGIPSLIPIEAAFTIRWLSMFSGARNRSNLMHLHQKSYMSENCPEAGAPSRPKFYRVFKLLAS
jgi:hypothetical protein